MKKELQDKRKEFLFHVISYFFLSCSLPYNLHEEM